MECGAGEGVVKSECRKLGKQATVIIKGAHDDGLGPGDHLGNGEKCSESADGGKVKSNPLAGRVDVENWRKGSKSDARYLSSTTLPRSIKW